MPRSFVSRWAIACAGLAVTAGWGRAQVHHLPPAGPACASAPPPKVVIHVPEPEVVYDKAPACSDHPGLFKGLFSKHKRAKGTVVNGGTVTTASVLTPLSFTSGFASQGFGLNGLVVQGASGFGAQAFGTGGTDLSDLRAAQELELAAARVASIQAAREAEVRSYGASIQRIRTHLSSIAPKGGAQGTTQGAGGIESCCEELKKQLAELKESIGKLEQEVKVVKKLCEERKGKDGK